MTDDDFEQALRRWGRRASAEAGPPPGGFGSAALGRQRTHRWLPYVAAASVVGVAVIASVLVRADPPTGDLRVAQAPAPTSATTTCEYFAAPDQQPAQPASPPPAQPRAAGPSDVVLALSGGEVRVRLDAVSAPCAVNSFRSLVEQRFYDGSECHRLTISVYFILQCGDPTGTGNGGPGYIFADENLGKATYAAGTIAMANGGPDTNGSQFFLVYRDSELPTDYTPFGKITAGLEVLQEMARRGIDGRNGPADGMPAQKIILQSARNEPR